MNEEEFLRTNIKVACVLKMDLASVDGFKKDFNDLIKKHGGSIIYHTVSPYKLKIVEEKQDR